MKRKWLNDEIPHLSTRFTATYIIIINCEFYKEMNYGNFRGGKGMQSGEQVYPVPLAIKHQLCLKGIDQLCEEVLHNSVQFGKLVDAQIMTCVIDDLILVLI